MAGKRYVDGVRDGDRVSHGPGLRQEGLDLGPIYWCRRQQIHGYGGPFGRDEAIQLGSAKNAGDLREVDLRDPFNGTWREFCPDGCASGSSEEDLHGCGGVDDD